MNVTDYLSLLTAVFDPFEWEWRILTLIHVVICIFLERNTPGFPFCYVRFLLNSFSPHLLPLLSSSRRSSFCAIITQLKS